MLNSIDSTQNINEIRRLNEDESTQVNRQYVSMRGNTYERTPDNDTFESDNKTAKTVGIVGGLLATAALVVGGICFKKGGDKLGKEAKFGEKLKEGWKELWNKGKDKAEEAASSVADDSAGAATDATKEKGLSEVKKLSEEEQKEADEILNKINEEEKITREAAEEKANIEFEERLQENPLSPRLKQTSAEEHSKLEKEYTEVWEKHFAEKEKLFREETDKEARAIVNEFNEQYIDHVNTSLHIARRSETQSIKNIQGSESKLLQDFIPYEGDEAEIKHNILKVLKKGNNGSQVEYYCDKEGKNVFEIRVTKDGSLDYVVQPFKGGNISRDRFDTAYVFRPVQKNGKPRKYNYTVSFDNKKTKLIEIQDYTTWEPEQGFIKTINVADNNGKTFLKWNKANDEGKYVSSNGQEGSDCNWQWGWFELNT